MMFLSKVFKVHWLDDASLLGELECHFLDKILAQTTKDSWLNKMLMGMKIHMILSHNDA